MRQSEIKWRIILRRLSETSEVSSVSQERIRRRSTSEIRLSSPFVKQTQRFVQRNSQQITGLGRTVGRKRLIGTINNNCSFD